MAARDPAGAGVALCGILRWWDACGRDLPWRRSRDVYAIWVAEVMAAQTSVDRAAAAWARWMERWPTVEALASASLADVLIAWQGLGYPRRARDLHRSAVIVAAGGWPEDLRELPGIGAYVDAAIRCFAFEEAVLPLDVNVRRVLARRFPDGVDARAEPWRAGQALMEFGQRICAARPRCCECPVSAGCPADPVAGVDPAPKRRPQARYEGSMRQRRGMLLRDVLARGQVPLAGADAAAAAGLADDGLVRIEGAAILAMR